MSIPRQCVEAPRLEEPKTLKVKTPRSGGEWEGGSSPAEYEAMS